MAIGEPASSVLCGECLENRIHKDFSDQLIFSYPISHAPLASTAVVRISNPAGAGGASPEFALVYVPIDGSRDGHCFTKYINECCILEVLAANNSCSNLRDDDHHHLQSRRGESSTDVANKNNNNGKALSEKSLPWFQTECSTTCKYSARFSCSRTVSSLAPIARLSISSSPSSAFQHLVSALNDYSCSSSDHYVEDPILSSLTCLIEGKATTRDSLNFLTLTGIPSFADESSTVPGCLRHPNIVPVLCMLKSSHDYINLVLPKTPYTLESVLYYSPCFFKSEWRVMFIMYQLLSALSHLHGLGVAHGNVCPLNVMLTDSCWIWLRIFDDKPQLISSCMECSPSPSFEKDCLANLSNSHYLESDIDWHTAFTRWWKGEMSNFMYLLVLNRLAGRRWGDHKFHTVMPWVIDFSVKHDEATETGWRDLSKSKWRLAKGDEQLDFTYSTSEVPHHVSDECLSELAVCSYKARRLPLSVLRTAVRSVYEPNEYPSSMQRLYQWTPDECIPEFYCDPNVFCSRHSGMNDLAVPWWAATPEEFIKLHRDALESDRVSSQIHQWIDITFGYKMSGEAALAAKNVMLHASDPTQPRSVGRRQLFTQPHPARCCLGVTSKTHNSRGSEPNGVEGTMLPCVLSETAYLQQVEEAAAFCEHARHLSPLYSYVLDLPENEISFPEQPLSEDLEGKLYATLGIDKTYGSRPVMDVHHLIENIEVDDDMSAGYQQFFLWKQKASRHEIFSQSIAEDIFSAGCILAELHLGRPLFDPTSLAVYSKSGTVPRLIQELSPQTRILVEACICRDWWRRPSAKCLLESPYFETTVKSAYMFLAPLQLLAKDGSRLRYASSFAKQGALKAMGPFAAEMCAPYCLELMVAPLSDAEAELAFILLKEFFRCLKPNAARTLILPAIQKILQTTGYSHLKVSLLQNSFVREIWTRVGKQAYLEIVHASVISNLHVAPHKQSAGAASVLLIGSSEELGVPVTVHQTILPLIHCFGKGLCSEGIDVLVRIGGLLGEKFVVNQILPFLRNVVHSCLNASHLNKPEPMQNWSSLALIDCILTLEGLAAVLSKEVVVKELIEDGSCLHVMVLMQMNLELPVLQIAATSLVAICEQIGPDFTALHVLPKLKGLFDELAFSQEISLASVSLDRSLSISRPVIDEEGQMESHMNLVVLLYPSFASLLGIEKLRQCCATWLLLEQFLLRHHKWKWEYNGESPRGGTDNVSVRRTVFSKSLTLDYAPAKLLLNGVGWSIPQSQGNKSPKNLMPLKQANDIPKVPIERNTTTSTFEKHEPWHWFPSPASSWDGLDFLSRAGTIKDDHPWKIRASVVHSTRVHHGAVRSLAVCQDESMIFTAGVGPGFRGTVQKWNLSRIQCTSGYYGHEEVVNDICVLSSHERVASCDGIVHVWNVQTGKLISIFAESDTKTSGHISIPSASATKINSDQLNLLNSNPLSSGILTSAFDGSLYTCMHHLEFTEKLVVGTGNGSIRFIDIPRGDKLHLWRTETGESSFTCLVSSICSSGSGKAQADRASASWIGAGFSSGMCRLLDVRSGNVIASWRAHDGYVTKLDAPEDHLLVSSSLDRTLRVWDLRRNIPPQPIVFRGHSDGLSSFSVWGQDVISIARNKIGLSSLSRSSDEDGQHRVTPQNLYSANRGTKNMSQLSSLCILPYSRLFLVGTEDGHLKICC